MSALQAAMAGCLSRGSTGDPVSSAAFALPNLLQSALRKLAQLAFGMKNKRLPASVAAALLGTERVHDRPLHFRCWLGHRVRPLSQALCYRIDNGGCAVGVPRNIQPHCGPVKSCRAALRGLRLLWGTGIPSVGPFLLKRGQVFEQRADPCRLPQVLMMQQPGVPPVSRGNTG